MTATGVSQYVGEIVTAQGGERAKALAAQSCRHYSAVKASHTGICSLTFTARLYRVEN